MKLLPLILQKQTWKNISNYFLHLYPVKKTFQKGDHCLIWGPTTVNTYSPHPRILGSSPFSAFINFIVLWRNFFWKSSDFKSTDYKSTWKLFLFLQARKKRFIFSPKLPPEHMICSPISWEVLLSYWMMLKRIKLSESLFCLTWWNCLIHFIPSKDMRFKLV